MLKLVNEYRAQKGLKKLAYDAGWKTEYADRLTKDIMCKKNVLQHGCSSPEVVCLQDADTSAKEIVQTFKDSPPHNAILLDEESLYFACSVYSDTSKDTAFVVIIFHRWWTFEEVPKVSKESIDTWFDNGGHY